MYKINNERATDLIIGEAMLDLLSGGCALSSRALLEKLQQMAKLAVDEEREQVIQRAIKEVQHSLNLHKEQSRMTMKDVHSMEHSFRSDKLPGNNRKH